MSPLRSILPVVDIKAGHVVHGVAGQRDGYAPIQSCLLDSAVPDEVAARMCGVVRSREVYVADLDSIAGEHFNRAAFESISRRGISVWLDAGIVDAPSVARLLSECEHARIILGLESLPTLRTLEWLIAKTTADRLVFSLDMKSGVPITADPMARKLSPDTIAAFAIDAGISTMIVLDLVAVGTASGLHTLELCRKIRARYEQLELVSGGGVQDMEDVRRYVEAGCDRVLVATALHAGAIEPEDAG